MAKSVALGCGCGAFNAVVRKAGSAGSNHVICGCRFCRAFAHHLGQADEILDEHGGTASVQVSPRYLDIASGFDKLRCTSVTSKGALRWYTTCCNTPVASTFRTGSLPFLGIAGSCIREGNEMRPVSALFGPVRARVDSAPGTEDSGRHKVAWMFARFFLLMAFWRLRGDQKHSPFFDPATGEPVLKPVPLTAEERKAAFEMAEAGSAAA